MGQRDVKGHACGPFCVSRMGAARPILPARGPERLEPDRFGSARAPGRSETIALESLIASGLIASRPDPKR